MRSKIIFSLGVFFTILPQVTMAQKSAGREETAVTTEEQFNSYLRALPNLRKPLSDKDVPAYIHIIAEEDRFIELAYDQIVQSDDYKRFIATWDTAYKTIKNKLDIYSNENYRLGHLFWGGGSRKNEVEKKLNDLHGLMTQLGSAIWDIQFVIHEHPQRKLEYTLGFIKAIVQREDDQRSTFGRLYQSTLENQQRRLVSIDSITPNKIRNATQQLETLTQKAYDIKD